MIADFDPTGPFINDTAPAVDEDALNNIEDGITAVTNEVQRLSGDPATPDAVIAIKGQHKLGNLMYVGNDAAFQADLGWMHGYVAVGIYFDGTNWQNPGGVGSNGWSVLAFQQEGEVYLYSDGSTGNDPRVYTPAEFIARRVGAVPATPATFFEDGTIDGQAILWDAAAGAWAISEIDVPSRWTDSKTTITSLGPSATGTIDLLNGEITVPADTMEIGQMLSLRCFGRILNNSGGGRTITWTPKLGGVDLGIELAPSVTAGSALNKYWRAVVEILRTGTATAEASVQLVVGHHQNSADAPFTMEKNAAVTGLDFTLDQALLLNGNITLSDPDLSVNLSAASVEVI